MKEQQAQKIIQKKPVTVVEDEPKLSTDQVCNAGHGLSFKIEPFERLFQGYMDPGV